MYIYAIHLSPVRNTHFRVYRQKTGNAPKPTLGYSQSPTRIHEKYLFPNGLDAHLSKPNVCSSQQPDVSETWKFKGVLIKGLGKINFDYFTSDFNLLNYNS